MVLIILSYIKIISSQSQTKSCLLTYNIKALYENFRTLTKVEFQKTIRTEITLNLDLHRDLKSIIIKLTYTSVETYIDIK